MKDSKLRYSTLLQLVENAQDGITVAEKEGQDTILIYVNPGFEKLTGYAPQEILYRDCRFLQGADSDPEAVRAVREAIETNEPVRTILKNYRKDGSCFWNELSITPFYDEVDRRQYYIGIQKDVSEVVELKQQLEAAQKKLQQLEG
ncbi:hypothetical protein CYQ88_05220 [Hydrogenovibrio sp. SC-1]|uniref:PAS domain-containing protein n=1 Tax=Hydrogenovibrio sp. SC-1 TaxID=2065820 RepID=UPI000C7C3E9C|nr:PAS domain-containing protein [Hydrogenovibrio sp. SC-1]PLA74713.1 hypothetical protein CYQ88_05220 [Hydrogenovibrio sp. SC-1]